METMTMIEVKIIVPFLIILEIFFGYIIYSQNKKIKKLRIKNSKLKNIINDYYMKYGYFSNIKNVNKIMKKFKELRKLNNFIRKKSIRR